jgi:microcystin-dependent protein
MEGTIGEIRMFAATFSPKTWNYCDGSTIQISSNTALFSILGTTFGGNGTTTFQLPDLRGRVAVGAGNATSGSVYQLGQKGGAESTTLTTNNIPPHTHTGTANISIPAYSEAGNTSDPNGNNLATVTNMYAPSSVGADSSLAPFAATVQDGITGAGQPFSLMKAHLGMNYIICMYGVYPQRS